MGLPPPVERYTDGAVGRSAPRLREQLHAAHLCVRRQQLEQPGALLLDLVHHIARVEVLALEAVDGQRCYLLLHPQEPVGAIDAVHQESADRASPRRRPARPEPGEDA